MQKLKDLYCRYEEIINYLIVGVLTTIVSLLVYYGLTLTIMDANNPLELQITNILSWVIAVNFAYVTNRKYVFKKKNGSFKELIKFYLSRLATLFIDMLIMYIFVSVLKYNDQIMKLISQVVITVTNYILSKFIVFKKGK